MVACTPLDANDTSAHPAYRWPKVDLVLSHMGVSRCGMASEARTRNSVEPTWVVYVLGGKRAQRLGTIEAPDHAAAIAKAIDEFGITDPERRRRVAVSSIER